MGVLNKSYLAEKEENLGMQAFRVNKEWLSKE